MGNMDNCYPPSLGSSNTPIDVHQEHAIAFLLSTYSMILFEDNWKRLSCLENKQCIPLLAKSTHIHERKGHLSMLITSIKGPSRKKQG